MKWLNLSVVQIFQVFTVWIFLSPVCKQETGLFVDITEFNEELLEKSVLVKTRLVFPCDI